MLLAAADAPPPVGQIWVEAPSGFSVLLDGRSAGTVAEGRRGLLLSSVTPGRHQVVVRAGAGGAATTFDVDVRAYATENLKVSALSLLGRRTLQPQAGDVLVTSVQTLCSFTIGRNAYQMTGKELVAKNIAPGLYSLVATCGKRRLEGNVQVEHNRVSLIELDEARGVVRATGDRDRAVRVNVKSSAYDSVARAEIPGAWKRVIMSAISPGVESVDVSKVGLTSIHVAFRCKTETMAQRIADTIQKRPEVKEVKSDTYSKHADGSFSARMTIHFLTE